MRIGSLFSGIGGLELGLERAGLGPVVWQAESNEDRRAWLSDHWPHATRLESVEDVNDQAGAVDLVCGGFPCQDLSTANQRGRGLAGERSGLWREFAWVVEECQPRWIVVENVHHAWRRWVPTVRGDLWRLGYASVPLRVRASEVGALHFRARTFIVADRDGVILRQQQGRRGWKERLGAAVAAVNGATWDTPDADGAERGWTRDCVVVPYGMQGTARPALVCSVHGISAPLAGRSYRIAALGDSVVPQCAEVVGRVIVGLLE